MTHQRVACWAVSLSTLMSCACDHQTGPGSQPDINIDSPSGNALVVREHIGGEPAFGSQFVGLLEAGDGTWFGYGFDNDDHALTRLGAGGPIWTRRVGFSVRGAARVSTPWLAGLVTVGSFDTDSDGEVDEARLTLWNDAGTRLDEIALGVGHVRAANDVVIAGTAADRVDLVVVGYGRSTPGGTLFPWMARAAVQADSNLARGEERTDATRLWHVFRSVVREGSGSGAYYVGGNALEDETSSANAFVQRLSDSLSVEWHKDLIVTPGFKTSIGLESSLGWTGGSLIAVGNSEVVKSGAPGDGGYWRAGLVTSLSPQGQVEWQKTVSLTRHTELFSSCWLDGGFVYCVGAAAVYQYNDTGQTFGYGLLSKVNASDGAIAARITFGDPSLDSGFFTGIVHGNLARCAGWTNRTTATSGYQSWFVEIDLTRPPAAVTTTARAAVEGSGREAAAAPLRE